MDAAGQAEAVDPGQVPLAVGFCIRIHTVEAIEARKALDSNSILMLLACQVSAPRLKVVQ